MNDIVRQKLGAIVAKHGASVIENPRRCEGLLRDYAGAFRREVSVLTMALEERVPLDLLAAGKSIAPQVLFGRLTQRLCDNLALSEPAARWAVYSWAFALGIISDKELEIVESTNKQQSFVPATIAATAQIAAPQKTQAGSAQPNHSPKPAANTVSSLRQSFIVSADGNGDFASISEAVRRATANTRLTIRPGIYNESVVIDKHLEIVGDGAAKDIVVASINSSCVQMRADKALVRNLTLIGRGAQNGKAFFAVDVPIGELTLENCDISSDSLSCIAIHGVNSNPTIKNCRIHDGVDSGVYFFDNARGQIVDSEIYRNGNVGAAIAGGANPTIKNCRIYEGKNGGVVVWQNGAAGTIEDCVIFGHRLANVGVSEYANPTFRRCEIYGSSDTGVYVQQNGYGVFEDCDVYSNEDAEVAVSTGGNPLLRRCTIHNGRHSGVFIRDKGRGLIENCNIYGNREAGVSVSGESVVAVRQCNINRNGTVAVSVRENSRASVEDSDLRGNRVATWESEYGVVIERKNNRE